MRKYQLLSVIRKRMLYKSAGKPHSVLPNFINQKWVTDITYIRTSQGKLFLSVI